MTTLRLPPVVYVPTMVDVDGNTRVKMHALRDNRVALFVFSAIDRLEAQYGEGAPWVLLQAPELQQAHDSAPFDLLLLDRDLHPEEGKR